MAFIENVYREDLNDTEKAKSIAAIYQDIGFKLEEAISTVKYLYNRKIASIILLDTDRITAKGNRSPAIRLPTDEFFEASRKNIELNTGRI